MADLIADLTTNGKSFRTDSEFASNGNVINNGLSLDSQTNRLMTTNIREDSDSPEMDPLCDSADRCRDISAKNKSANKTSFMPLVAEDEREYSCGLCSLRPKWLQMFANKQTFLVIFCLTSILQGMYYTYFVSVLTTIEKLYQIQSKTTGMIMSATEIGQIGGALLLTYYGGHGHRPKWIACGMLIFALASILCSTPHYLFGSGVGNHLSVSRFDPSLLTINSSKLSEYDTRLCSSFGRGVSSTSVSSTRGDSLDESQLSLILERVNSSQIDSKCDHKETINTKSRITNTVLSIFFVSLLLIGIGATAVNTLGIPYIDDNVAPKESPLYFGIKSIFVTLSLSGLSSGQTFSKFSFVSNQTLNQISKESKKRQN